MNWKIILLAVVLLDFAALSVYAIYQVGYVGLFQAGLASWGAAQILADLVIACSLIIVWMVRDARARGLNPWGFVAITLVAGSFGPLLYLLRRETAPAGAKAVREYAARRL